MAYALDDFTESLHRVGIERTAVRRVVAAWGNGPEFLNEWDGGFLMEMQDARFAYVWGWCDSSGWGCQDNAEVAYFDIQPPLDTLPESEAGTDWDHDPADLNLWLREKATA